MSLHACFGCKYSVMQEGQGKKYEKMLGRSGAILLPNFTFLGVTERGGRRL